MSRINIDVGASTCSGGCEHCRFGSQAGVDNAQLSSDTFRITERLIAFAKSRGDQVRLAFTNPLLTLAEVPFLESVDVLSVSLQSLSEVQTKRRDILEKLIRFSGKELQFHFNHTILSLEEAPLYLPPTAALMHGVCEELHQVRVVLMGFNHNTALYSNRLLQDGLVLGNAFNQYLEEQLGGQFGFGLSELRQQNTGPCTHTSARVRNGNREFVLHLRYILPPEEAFIYGLSPFSFDMQDTSILVMDKGVHVAHLPHAINQSELWFSHAAFGDLLNQAASEGQSLTAVCKAAVEYRQSMKRV